MRARRWWGPPRGTDGEIVLALSPREGRAYSRLPLIMLSAAAGGDDAALRTLRHETGHLWWSAPALADGDDWPNEGLAEYAASRLAPDPDAPRDQGLGTLEPVRTIRRSGQETQPSGSRHRNLYLRPALAFTALEAEHGAAALDQTLRGFLDPARRASSLLTTTVALEHVSSELGAQWRSGAVAQGRSGAGATLLAEMLTTPGWVPRR